MSQAVSTTSSPMPTRRQFIVTGMALVGAAWAGTALQSVLFPVTTAAEAKPVTFPLSELPIGGTKPITYAGAAALVIRTPESVRCFSLVCTHLGCLVQWQAADKSFHCPCHDGRFDQFGEVTAGPPPLPLEQIAVRVAGEMVTVGEMS